MKPDHKPKNCAFCHREGIRLTKHHLIPATLHSNKWFKKNFTKEEMQQAIWVCRPCHNAIHRFIPHKLLAREYSNLQKLLEHPDIYKFVEWQKKR